ncbi:MAG TPA: hypothetical protein PLZ79_10140 [Burkholderiales bacterium]|nr:hypothetical protein [Burkholderiales bacterium]
MLDAAPPPGRLWQRSLEALESTWEKLASFWNDPGEWIRRTRWRIGESLRLALLAIFPLAVLALLNFVMLGTDQGGDLLVGLREPIDAVQQWAFVLLAAYLGFACGLAAWIAVRVETDGEVARLADDPERVRFRRLLQNTVVLVCTVLALVPTWMALVSASVARAMLGGIALVLLGNIVLFGNVPPAKHAFGVLEDIAEALQHPQAQGVVNLLLILLAGVGIGIAWYLQVALKSLLVFVAALLLSIVVFGPGGWAERLSETRLRILFHPQRWYLVLLALGFLGAAIVSFRPGLLGAAGTILLALGFWALLLTGAIWLVRNSRPLPVLLSLVILLAMQMFPLREDPHRVALVQPEVADAAAIQTVVDRRRDFDAYVQAWLAKRDIGARERYPVYFVATEGGGIRAAYWTALVLARLHVATAGAWTDQVFAVSGVSGGSVGAAAFVAALAEARARDPGCNPRRIDFTAADRDRLLQMLERDHLAPVSGGLLFGDTFSVVTPWLWFGHDRAWHFERSLTDAFRAQFNGSRRFERPLSALWAEDAECLSLPSLILNSTEVRTGKRVLITDLPVIESKVRDAGVLQLPYPEVRPPCSDTAGNDARLTGDLSLVSAAHMSARFSYVSPAGQLVTRECGSTGAIREVHRQLVDGGYFDNSGAASLRELLAAFTAAAARARCGEHTCAEHLDLRVLLIENEPRAPVYRGLDDPLRTPAAGPISTTLACDGRPVEPGERGASRASNRTEQQLIAPLATFLNARVARASLAKDELGELVRQANAAVYPSCGAAFGAAECSSKPSIVALSIAESACRRDNDARVADPPLGWVLSAPAQSTMRRYACSEGWLGRLALRGGLTEDWQSRDSDLCREYRKTPLGNQPDA